MRYFLLCLVTFLLIAAPALAYKVPAPVSASVAVNVDVQAVMKVEIMNKFGEFEIQPECCGGAPVFTDCQKLEVDLCCNGPWGLYVAFNPEKWTNGLWFNYCFHSPNGEVYHKRILDQYTGPYDPTYQVPGLLIDGIEPPATFVNEIRYYSFCIEAEAMVLKGDYSGMLWFTMVDP